MLMLAPFAPHLAEELWQRRRTGSRCIPQRGRRPDPALVRADVLEMAVQVNGKVRDSSTSRSDVSRRQAREMALASDKVRAFTMGITGSR